MTDIHPIDGRLPDDLRALDEELSSIRYEERPSFGPELRAELARAYAEGPAAGSRPAWRRLAAAVVAALLVGGAAVPSARASLVRLLDTISPEAEPERVLPAPVTTPAPAFVPAATPPVVEAQPAAADVEVDELPSVATPTLGAEPVIIAPEMLDREASEDLLQSAYPMHLQRRGVGGTVWLQVWIDEFGGPGAVELSRSSGVPELDRAAIRVAPRFRFVPAMQDGRRTGTWIEFPVLFEPDPDRIERVLPPVVDPLSLPTVAQGEWWQLQDPIDFAELPPASEIGRADAAARVEAARGLGGALSASNVVDAYGPVETILEGEAPEGVPPTEWRAGVGSAFEVAITDGTETRPRCWRSDASGCARDSGPKRAPCSSVGSRVRSARRIPRRRGSSPSSTTSGAASFGIAGSDRTGWVGSMPPRFRKPSAPRLAARAGRVPVSPRWSA